MGGFGWLLPAGASRSRRTVVRLLGAAGIAAAFAVLIGLLVALVTGSLGGGSSKSDPAPGALTIPSAEGGTASAQVPPDWVAQTSNRGIPFSAPPGWTQRTDALVDFRVAPNPDGSPGVEQVGTGIASGSDPQRAAASYARNTYSGQPSYQEQPAIDEVSLRGERGRQVTVTYSRDGTPVQVVIRAFPSARGMLLVVSRAATVDPERAGLLASQLDASIRLS
jgi:hypothetical protein